MAIFVLIKMGDLTVPVTFFFPSVPKKKSNLVSSERKRLTTPSGGDVPKSSSSEPSSKWKSLGASAEEVYHTAPLSPPKSYGSPLSPPRSYGYEGFLIVN